MKIVIDIPDEILKAKLHLVTNPKRMMDAVDIAIANGIPLPKEHGRLIDADEVKKDHIRWLGYLDEDMILRLNLAVDKIPTILNADKAESEKKNA